MMRLQRGTFIALGASALTGLTMDPSAYARPASKYTGELSRLESKSGGRLGIYAFSSGGTRVIAYRAHERFPMCSTFKILAVAAVLHRVDLGHEQLSRRVPFTKADLEAYAPVTSAHVAVGSMTVAELCAAAIVMSDNTAANLLLNSMGGPAYVTAFMHGALVSDPLTRLDRTEPTLNTAMAGDRRDTTSPFHMAHDLELFIVTNRVLSHGGSILLAQWMHACRTGLDTLRAGVPSTWHAGDKTGSGENATRNDVAFFYRPNDKPIFVAAYLTEAHALNATGRDSILAAAARIVANAFHSGASYGI